MLPLILLLLNSLLTFVESDEGDVRVEATGAPSGATLSLHRLSSSRPSESPALFATVTSEKEKLTLRPAFALSPGETYEAHLSVKGEVVEKAVYKRSVSTMPAPRVIRILPDCETVPANLLKFYLEFDQPMREGREIFDQIHIVDLETGKKVHSPWRRRELWSSEGKRLTLWIHPGRVKQGVNLRQQLGPVLLPGKKYELRLDGSIQSPEGKSLAGEYRHPFATTDEDRSLIDVSSWKISAPAVGAGSLSIQCDRPLDPFLAARHIEISREGVVVESEVTWDNSQSRFDFHGDWSPGTYRITVGKYLEDLAGNTAIRVFDTDLSNPSPGRGVLEREFLVK